MDIFKKTRYGLTFSSMSAVKWFIDFIKGKEAEMQMYVGTTVHTDGDVAGIPPTYATKEAACADVAVPDTVIIKPHETVRTDLMLSFIISNGHKIVMYPRSSLLYKHGIMMPVSIIDSDYHGHVHAVMHNVTDEPVRFEKGTRVAQIECTPTYETVEWKRSKTEREGGFGSTGEK